MVAHIRRQFVSTVSLDTRLILSIGGRFIFTSRPTKAGANPMYRCRTQSISAGEFIITSSAFAKVGEAVAAVFDRIGPINGMVTRLVMDGFAMDVDAGEAERRSLAATINWMKRKQIKLTSDHRAAPRFKTRGEACVVRYGDETLECRVRDISATGANIASPVLPAVGTEMQIGTVKARVMRHAGQSFGVLFLDHEPSVASLMKDLVAAPN